MEWEACGETGGTVMCPECIIPDEATSIVEQYLFHNFDWAAQRIRPTQ
jgi:hypothetical protein